MQHCFSCKLVWQVNTVPVTNAVLASCAALDTIYATKNFENWITMTKVRWDKDVTGVVALYTKLYAEQWLSKWRHKLTVKPQWWHQHKPFKDMEGCQPCSDSQCTGKELTLTYVIARLVKHRCSTWPAWWACH